MNKLVTIILLFLFPTLLLAEKSGALSFTPPASDYSMIFLGNLFGIVDGILSSSGSQIMGAMFSIFNAAVLALGGIIIMYTLMVSTMNTAHEGQMLGQKWSSIWIPARSTIGLVLLIPKASGYCLMQIFIMWIVVQGVGAADKIWEAALGYLNRGGVIIQAQRSTPALDMVKDTNTSLYSGASKILTAQVCMLGLQKQLEARRKFYLENKERHSGPCYGTPSEEMAVFCNNAIPDLLGSVNVVEKQNESMDVTPRPRVNWLEMPNIKEGPYKGLSGICGTIIWNSIDALEPCIPQSDPTLLVPTGCTKNVGKGLTVSQLKTAQMSRSIAVQQMYVELSTIARAMVNNDPLLTHSNASSDNKNYSLNAKEEFGVPYTFSEGICKKYGEGCVNWGSASGKEGTPLFNGKEFQESVFNYGAIMGPALNLIELTKAAESGDDSRKFIDKAISEGWIMAGSYFFDLVRLNKNAKKTSETLDEQSGLNNTIGYLQMFVNGGTICSRYAQVCRWIGNSKDNFDLLQPINSLIDGTFSALKDGVPLKGDQLLTPDLNPIKVASSSSVLGLSSSSVYGFISNSIMVKLPGQPGLAPLEFANVIHFELDPKVYLLPEQSFSCGSFFGFCLGRTMGNIFFNASLRLIFNGIIIAFAKVLNPVMVAFFMVPLQGMADIFKQGIKTLSEPGRNPVLALADMGVQYINFSGNLWMTLISFSLAAAMIPILGPAVFALIMLGMPLVLAWIGIMVSVGFITAYYIPLLPYMLFTFGTLAWLIAVIEAMVAAPVVALGVTHPEGHDAFGKGEQAIMIMMNVFLRPALMIIGYIAGIALCYVGVWILNAGFDHAIGFIQKGGPEETAGCVRGAWSSCTYGQNGDWVMHDKPKQVSGSGNYSDWAGIYAYFFSILIYTTMYLTIVQKAFSLIAVLPDKVLRWIGGSPESAGEQSSQWTEQEMKGKTSEAGKDTGSAQGQVGSKMGAYATKKIQGGMPSSGSGEATAEGGGKPPGGEGGGGESTPAPEGKEGGSGDDDAQEKELAKKAALKGATGGVG